MTSGHWVVLELSQFAEGQDPDILRKAILNVVRGAEVFIPAVVTQIGGNRVFQYIMEGYAFVRRDRPDAALLRLANTRYVQSLLLGPGPNGRQCLATVSDVDVSRMREQAQREADQGIGIGDTVLITSGPYKEITGRVIEDIPETASVQVYVRLLSKEAILMLPRSFLRLLEKRVRPVLRERLPLYVAWAHAARSLAAYGADPDPMTQVLHRRTYLHSLCSRNVELVQVCAAADRLPLDTRPLGEAAIRQDRLRSYADQLRPVSALVHLLTYGMPVPRSLARAVVQWDSLQQWQGLYMGLRPVSVLSVTPAAGIAEKVIRYACLHDFRRAWDALTNTVQWVGGALIRLEDRMLDNVLIDGFNLVFRCRFAPALRDLKDGQGRPTGVIYGVLRSLASLQKRFPRATLHVCWDGSSKRRKAAYEGYKANRPVRGVDGFDQVGLLRGVLPLIGVVQHWNPDEEADDVIATLVKGAMAEQRNIIVSTDRDLLQLVDRMTIVLAPAMGSGKEKLYDEDAVVQEYGVEPAKMPQLRAMTGDTSDNLPGVSRIPVKTLGALVRSYATVDGIYASGMPGVTKAQYSKLREAEALVRMNADLMTLCCDISITRTDPNPDQAAAEARLADVDVQPETINVFFSDLAGFFK